MTHSRNKGSRGERAARDILRVLWPDCQRGAQQSRAGDAMADVEGTPFWVECKWQKRPNIQAAYRQAVAATDGRPILVMTKRDREPVLCTVDADTFIRLLEGKIR